MKFINIIAIVCLLLTGCVSLSQQGMDSLNAGQYQAAYNAFNQCALQGDSYCINNIGFMYEKGHMDDGEDLDKAIEYYTWAARYGNQIARNNLVVHGEEVPAVDLVAQVRQAVNPNDAANAQLLQSITNGYLQGQRQARARQQQALEKQQYEQMLKQVSKPVQCSSAINRAGNAIDTVCR